MLISSSPETPLLQTEWLYQSQYQMTYIDLQRAPIAHFFVEAPTRTRDSKLIMREEISNQTTFYQTG